jgi:hypothetical protein
MRLFRLFVAILLAAAAPLAAGKCDTDVVPAATLLFPYFEVDLEETYGRTTLASISNISPEPAMVKVTLWTDWAIPSVSFHVYLTGYDVQTLNLRDVLAFGRFPECEVRPALHQLQWSLFLLRPDQLRHRMPGQLTPKERAK